MSDCGQRRSYPRPHARQLDCIYVDVEAPETTALIMVQHNTIHHTAKEDEDDRNHQAQRPLGFVARR